MPTKDPLAIQDSATGLCGGLHTATIATVDLVQYIKFYVEAMEMTLEGPLPINKDTKKKQRLLWDIPDHINWDTYHLHRPEVPGLIQIRLLVLHQPTPSIHKSYSSREVGPFSLGFPNGDQYGLDKELKDRGFDTMAPIQVGTIELPTGQSYRYIETIYKAPDFLHAVGIERMDGMPPLSPIDERTKKGGPGYSAMVVPESDKMLSFLTEVLDMELRADRIWEASPDGALGIPAGVPFRFALVYAKGTAKNHLLFLDYKDDIFEEIEVPPRIPNRGLGMWTFETQNIEEVFERAMTNKVTIIQESTVYEDPILGKVKVMTMLAPNGFLIEVFQK